MRERKQELEKKLQDVSGQLGVNANAKKSFKKGNKILIIVNIFEACLFTFSFTFTFTCSLFFCLLLLFLCILFYSFLFNISSLFIIFLAFFVLITKFYTNTYYLQILTLLQIQRTLMQTSRLGLV